MSELPWEDGPAEVGPSSLCEWKGVASSGVLDLSGPCPRCGHDSTFNVHQTAIVVTASAAGSTLAEAFDTFNASTLFKCRCETVHAHPKKMTVEGCGAYWVARPEREQNANRYTLKPVTAPKLIAAAQLVAKESVTAHGGLQTLAEKWIPGIAAIIGVLGLAGLVVSKDAVDGLDLGWRIGAFALVAFGVMTAVAATVLVYRAAFGWPTQVPLGTDADVLAAAEQLSTNKFSHRRAAPERAAPLGRGCRRTPECVGDLLAAARFHTSDRATPRAASRSPLAVSSERFPPARCTSRWPTTPPPPRRTSR
ncbi:hypothetical protein [Nocardioides sp. AN3]